MGKLRPLDTTKVIKILEKNDFQKVRSRKHTTFVLQYIIKQTGIPREEFCS